MCIIIIYNKSPSINFSLLYTALLFITGRQYLLTLPKQSSKEQCVIVTAPMVDHNETFTFNFEAERFLDGTGLVQVPRGSFSIVVVDGRCV